MLSSSVNKIGKEFQVNIPTDNEQRNPIVSYLSNERFVISWDSNGQDGSDYGVFAQLFDSNNGSKIGQEFQVNSYTSGNQENPSVSSLSNERFVIAWQSFEQDGDLNGVFAQLFASNNGSKIGQEFQVNSYTSGSQEKPFVCSLSNERFVIAWHSYEQDGSLWGVFAQIFSNNGSKIGKEFQVNSYTYSLQMFPFVSSLSNETFVIAWQSEGQDGSNWGVFAQIFASNSGRKIGQEFQVNSITDSIQMFPSVSLLSNETIVITWQSNHPDGFYYDVFAQLFSSKYGSKIGQEFQVNSFAGGNQEKPFVSSLSNEKFVITWVSKDTVGLHDGVFAQLFASNNGSKIGQEFQVNTYTSDDKNNPSISSLSNEKFVIAWQSFDEDDELNGVFAQIFSSKNQTINSSNSSNSLISSSNLSNSSNTISSSNLSNSSNTSLNLSSNLNSFNTSPNSSKIWIIIVSGIFILIGLIFCAVFKKYLKEKILFSNATDSNTKQKIKFMPINSNEIELNELNKIETK